ncbi:hypothetical protein [Paraburkholderia flagellata]|uniref:hypothetical protein n=1 Tax=Paraburkholderia flagellata TaxID=2883241 RepID=UPI001F4679C7|nr:hypothetical protein [Paraburkholderia flagellata]
MTNSTSKQPFNERMARHREMLAAAGFSRVSVFLCAEARRALAAQRRRGESMSGTLNRLIAQTCGGSRNESPEEARDFERRVRAAHNQIMHSFRSGRGPYITRAWVLRTDGSGSGVYVTADGVEEFDKDTRPP